jgi:NO-binding membrane sensor protein with MHYT domain
MHAEHPSFNLLLVGLSYAVAVLGSFTALQLAMMIPLARGRWQRWTAVLVAGTAMGAGAIWAMHFIGMLAFDSGMPMAYDIGLTVLSALVAVAACSLGLGLTSSGLITWRRAMYGGLYMGLGVAGMHYLGMAAMRMPATLSYQGALVLGSVLIAIIASVAALWLAFTLRGLVQMIGSALVMGAAVCGMHYTGMAAVRFEPVAAMARQDMAQALPAHPLGMVVFGVVSLLLLLTLLLHRLRLGLLQRAFISGYAQAVQRSRPGAVAESPPES